MVMGCAWVRVFLVAEDKALACALQVWGAMADGEVRRQRETGRGAHRGWHGRMDGGAVLIRGHVAPVAVQCRAEPRR